MHRLMIADSNEIFLMAAENAFSADFEIRTCQDGETALELLAEFKPHVLIINFSLPYKDGLTVLQEASWNAPVIIATTPIILPYIERACLALNVGYLMVSPYLHALQVRTIDMVNQWESGNSQPNLHAQTIMHLHILNFPTHRVGYRQLCQAIPMYYMDRDQCLETVLYADIARIFHKSSGGTVERSIRAVIEDAWKDRDPIVWKKYFPGHTNCPSNKVFFDALADHLQE